MDRVLKQITAIPGMRRVWARLELGSVATRVQTRRMAVAALRLRRIFRC